MSEQPGVGVVAAGAWGTALAKLLAEKGVPTRIGAHEPEVVDSINTERENAVFLAGVRLPESLRADANLAGVLHESAVIVNAVPTFHRSCVTEPAYRGCATQEPEAGVRKNGRVALSIVKTFT